MRPYFKRNSLNDDVRLMHEEDWQLKPKRTFLSKCILFQFIFVFPLVSLSILFVSNYFLFEQIEWYQCLTRFEYLGRYESVYGDFVSRFYLDKCYESRGPLPKIGVVKNSSLPQPPKPDKAVCSSVADDWKFDCFPRGNVSEEDCNARGCCFNVSSEPLVPSCFYPSNFTSYKISDVQKSDEKISARMLGQFRSPYPNDAENLTLEISFVNENQLLVKIFDPSRSSGGNDFHRSPAPGNVKLDTLYDVDIQEGATGFKVIRKKTKQTIFNTQNIGGLIYSEQLLQISAALPTKNIFGIGERRGSVRVNTDWNAITLFAHDVEPTDKVNGYGTYPVYLCIEDSGLSHMVTFARTYAMDILVQPAPAITFRTIGGNLAFLITLGESPTQVVAKHSKYFTTPPIPPYWSLGFHLSRFGHKTLADLINVWNKTRSAEIPFDTQWSDIDYMSKRNDFTIDPVRYKGLKEFVNQLHSEGMHFVPILDPGISAGEKKGTYPPYDQGAKEKIFIMDPNGQRPYLGKVWNPNSTAFVDFSHPRSIQYWTEQVRSLHDRLPFDGLWIDMNEPSNFVNGSDCPPGPIEQPPYVPGVQGGKLSYKTVCMSAQHFKAYHYEVHNDYGMLEAAATSLALAEVRQGKRPFIISRSTNFYSSQYAGHWTGDVYSTWDDLKQSVRDLISFSLFGQPMVGSDICGFNGNTTVTLCSRWTQLGAFYPFSRNHNSDENIAQDPVSLGDEVVKSAKKSLTIRYSLLPYLYTLFWQAHTTGAPLIRPAFFDFPKDTKTYDVEDQFMWGPGLLVAPFLEESLTYRKVYLGNGTWYDWYSKEKTESPGKVYAASAPQHAVPLFLRAGHILPLQEANVTTTLSRKNPFQLKGGLDQNGSASGVLYWDDGETLASPFNVIQFGVSNNTLTSKPEAWNYETSMKLNRVVLLGVGKPVKKVTLNSTVITHFNYTIPKQELIVTDLDVDLHYPFTLSWWY